MSVVFKLFRGWRDETIMTGLKTLQDYIFEIFWKINIATSCLGFQLYEIKLDFFNKNVFKNTIISYIIKSLENILSLTT